MITKEDYAKLVATLEGDGYRKSTSPIGYADYTYWKSFGVTYNENRDKIIAYQIGFDVYHYTKFPNFIPYEGQCIGVTCKFLSGPKTDMESFRIDLSIDETTKEDFELLCSSAYEFVKVKAWRNKS
jgi:hypothetical protein